MKTKLLFIVLMLAMFPIGEVWADGVRYLVVNAKDGGRICETAAAFLQIGNRQQRYNVYFEPCRREELCILQGIDWHC